MVDAKIELPDVTLLGIDCINTERLQGVLDICEKDIKFGASKLLTSLNLDDRRFTPITHIGRINEYSRFCLEDLHKYVDTEHVLIVQYDGFILNPRSWRDDFLDYDYIGAPWLVADWLVKDFNFPKHLLGTRLVGNGGFSLRSKKILEVASRLVISGKIPNSDPEDIAICVWYKDLFRNEGIKFAPPELAARFSIEGKNDVYANQFGFHSYIWTDISCWVDAHPEYPSIAQVFKKERQQAT